MPTEIPASSAHVREGERDGATRLAAAIAFTGFAATGAFGWLLPSPIVLPALCIVAFAAALGMAAVAWLSAQRVATGITYWDITGALTLASIVAALLSDPGLVLSHLEPQVTD